MIGHNIGFEGVIWKIIPKLSLYRLYKTVLMIGHNIGFEGVIWKIIPKLSPLPLLIWITVLKQCFAIFSKIDPKYLNQSYEILL